MRSWPNVASNTAPSTHATPASCAALTGSPNTMAANATALTGTSAVINPASAPLIRAAPAYQSTKPTTVGTSA